MENVIVCGIALGLAVLGWAVSRKWGRKEWQKGAAVIAAAACLGLLSGYMELQTDEDPEKGLLRRENGEGDDEADLKSRQPHQLYDRMGRKRRKLTRCMCRSRS